MASSLRLRKEISRICVRAATAFVFAVLVGTVNPAARAQTFSVVHSFAGYPTDGANSYGDMIQDAAGNLYGVTYFGGYNDAGTIFKIDSSGAETTLFAFSRSDFSTGLFPEGGLFRDPAGNVFGTTTGAGKFDTSAGTIFKLDTDNQLTVLHTFNAPSWGLVPWTRLVGVRGSLYGTTVSGGCGSPHGTCGVIFKLNSAGRYAPVYTFTGGADGSGPDDLIRDSAGNLYGVATQGGSGFGTVFKLDTSDRFTVLHTFTGGADGGEPIGRLLRDVNGVIHGVALVGPGGGSGGEVFRLDTNGDLTILHKFLNWNTGMYPQSLLDVGGTLYGTTAQGGDPNCNFQQCGVLFRIGKTGQYAVVHNFESTDGEEPIGALTLGKDGGIYGVTLKGGATCPSYDLLNSFCGVVFKYKP